jgi:probable phosphomutase (TIGR03848 family)
LTTPEDSNGKIGPEAHVAQTSQPFGDQSPTGSDSAPQLENKADAKPAPKPTRILLIRHGVNDYVKKGLLAGRTPGVHLNEEGIAQALAVAERLSGEKITAIYSSPLERCQETAAPLANRLALELQPLEDVKETNCGDWTGQALEELRKLEAWMQVQLNPSGFRFPEGESMLEIQARMVTGLDRLQRQHPNETIAVFSHSDPIKLAVAFYVGMPLDLFQRLEVSPASISELDFTPLRVRLVRLNDCAHVPPAAEPPEAAAQPDAEQAAGESPSAKGALEEQVTKGPHWAGPEPEALQVSDDGKMQATGG